MTDAVLKTENLYYQYPTRSDFALSNVNISIERGEFIAIIGQNGSGKTTLVKHFNGLLTPTSGKMIIEGQDTVDLNTAELAKSVGYVFQNPDHQIFAEKVCDEIAFGPKNLGYDEERIEKTMKVVLQDVGLSGYEDTPPFKLSRGQRQRLAVASILAMEPSILVVDEPTTGQDWSESIAVMELVKHLHEKGNTCIVITHNMNLLSLYSERVIVMANGEVLLDGPTQETFCETETLKKASIKPPEVYELASQLLPDLHLNELLTPEQLADLLVDKVLPQPQPKLGEE